MTLQHVYKWEEGDLFALARYTAIVEKIAERVLNRPGPATSDEMAGIASFRRVFQHATLFNKDDIKGTCAFVRILVVRAVADGLELSPGEAALVDRFEAACNLAFATLRGSVEGTSVILEAS